MRTGTFSGKMHLVAFLSLVLAGCGGGGGSGGSGGNGTSDQRLEPGIFVDSGVSGLTYSSGPVTGETDASGGFQYQVVSGEPQLVSFSLGEMELGSAVGRSVLTPMDLLGATSTSDPRVINLLRLLQTLDEDSNPENGIVISQQTQAQFTSLTDIDFSSPLFDGGEPLATIFTNLAIESGDIVDAESAVQHFEETIQNQPELSLFSIGGNASGLIDAVELRVGSGILEINSDGVFEFRGSVVDGFGYNIEIVSTGDDQACELDNAAGTIDGGNVTDIDLQCSPASAQLFTLGGSVNGLAGQLKLINNGSDELTLTSDGAFAFTTPVADGSDFNVQISQQPIDQVCSVDGAIGAISGSDVTSVLVSCVSTDVPLFFVGGELSGLTGPIELNINNTETLSFSGTEFLFPTGLEDGSSYQVSVLNEPVGQNCSISNASGTITSGDIDNIAIICTTEQYEITGVANGHSGDVAITLVVSGNETVRTVSSGLSTFSFGEFAHGSVFSASVSAQPPGQECTLSPANSTLTSTIQLSIACSDLPRYTLSGSSSGIPSGETLQIELKSKPEQGASFEILSSFDLSSANNTFAAELDAGDDYKITIVSQPLSATCLINGLNSLAGVDISADQTGLSFSCEADLYNVELVTRAEDAQGSPVPLANLLSAGGALEISVDGQSPVSVESGSTTLLSNSAFPQAGVSLRLFNSLVSANCVLPGANSEGVLSILSAPADKTGSTSNIYNLQVNADCSEKVQFALSFVMEGVNTGLITEPVASVQVNEETPVVIEQNAAEPSAQRYYRGFPVGIELTENLNGYSCVFSDIKTGETAPIPLDPGTASVDAFALNDDTQYTISCEGEQVPLGLVVSDIDQAFDVALQVDGSTSSFTLNPVAISGPSLLTLTSVTVGAELQGLSFTALPSGISNCQLQDQADFVSDGALSGVMPATEINLIASCDSTVSVATATSDENEIPDAALRACIANSLDPEQPWDNVQTLSCPYDTELNDPTTRISDLAGIERFVNLQEINFNNHSISNLDPLLSLLDLESAFLANNPTTLEEREKLNVLDELDQTVFVSGSGTVADAVKFEDVDYTASVEIVDSEIYVLSGNSREIEINYSVDGCLRLESFSDPEFSVQSRLFDGSSSPYVFESDESCLDSGATIPIDFEAFSSRETRQARFGFIFGGPDNELSDVLYAEFDFVPLTVPSEADILDELAFADVDMKNCLIELTGTNTTIVESLTSLNLSACSTPPLDLSGIEQLMALESLDVGALPVSSTGLLSELVFLESFSRESTTSLADESWRLGIDDPLLEACVDENIAENSDWSNWDDVDTLNCVAPSAGEPGSSITDLSGIDQFEQLSSLTLPGHPVITGVGALRKLPVLTTLELEPSLLFQDQWASSGGPGTGRRNPRYQFNLSAAQAAGLVEIGLSSQLVDSRLYVLDESGAVVASDNDLASLDSSVSVLLEPGTYEVVAATATAEQEGSFEVSANVELAPVLRRLKTPVLADTSFDGAGNVGLSGTVEDAIDTGDFTFADVDIDLGIPQKVVFHEFQGAPDTEVDVDASVSRSGSNGSSGDFQEFVAYGYRYSLVATNNVTGDSFSTSRSCNLDRLDFSTWRLSSDSTDCFGNVFVGQTIDSLSLSPGEYETTIDYVAYYRILDDSSQTISVSTNLLVLDDTLGDIRDDLSADIYGCLSSQGFVDSDTLSGSFSSINLSACSGGTEVDLTGVDKFYQLNSLNLNNVIVTAGMSDLSRVPNSVVTDLDGLKVDLSNSDLLSEFIVDPALRQCVSDNLPEFYDATIDALTSLNCSGYGIYHLGGLKYLQELRSVDLSNNLLEDNDVQVLLQLSPSVATVDVTGNNLSFAAIAELQTHFDGTATFLPAGPAPVLPSVVLDTNDTDFEVSWQTDPSVTRYDLLYRFDGGVYRTVSNVTPPVSVSFPGAINSYGVQVIVTNDLGSDSVAKEQSVP